MDCLILAGGRPFVDDPLYQYSKGRPKALINIAGKPMIAWILDAMIDAQFIDSITVVGLEKQPHYEKSIVFLPDEGSIVDNVDSGLTWVRKNNLEVESVLLCSSDIPTITAQIVDQIAELCLSSDYAIYYPVVPKDSMLSRFPTSNRTFVRLTDLETAGSDLIVVHAQAFDIDLEIWRSITDARKYPWRIAQIVGLTTLLKLFTRRLSLAEAILIGEELVGLPVKVLLTDLAEIAMDVDTPEQMFIVSEELNEAGGLT